MADAPPGLPFAMPWVASVPSLEQMDHRMVALAVDSARTVRSKTQLWRYIEEVGVSPLLAALKKNLGASPATTIPDVGEKEVEEREDGAGASGGIGAGFGAVVGAGSAGVGAGGEAVIDSRVLRTEAVEAILHLMNVAMDLVGGVKFVV